MQQTQRGKGVLFIYGNYAGDNMNFDIAAELLEEEGIPTRTVRVNDDMASAPPERLQDRRGVAGDMMVLKIAGAAGRHSRDLDEIHRLAEKANQHTRTIGVALSALLAAADRGCSISISRKMSLSWAWAFTARPASGARR